MHFTSLKKNAYLVFYLSTEIPKRLVFQGFIFLLLILSCSAIPLQKVSRYLMKDTVVDKLVCADLHISCKLIR